jgi:hypothetical protein
MNALICAFDKVSCFLEATSEKTTTFVEALSAMNSWSEYSKLPDKE